MILVLPTYVATKYGVRLQYDQGEFSSIQGDLVTEIFNGETKRQAGRGFFLLMIKKHSILGL